MSYHLEVVQISMQLTSQAGLVQVLSYPIFLMVLIWPTHRGMEGWVNLLIKSNRNCTSSNHRSDKPYIALNSETYITIRQQELRNCKRIDYEFYCEELFVEKEKSKYSCKSAIYFNLNSEMIKENCRFKFYYDKTDFSLIVLDSGN